VWTWIFIVVGYVAMLFVFHLMGGFWAAGNAISDWGRRSSAKRRAAVERRIGLR